MEVAEFQDMLKTLCDTAQKNENKLEKKQIEEFFSGTSLTAGQLEKVLQYLKLKGCRIDGAEEFSGGGAEESPETEKKVPLTEAEEAYLKHYLLEIENQENYAYMKAAAELAAELNCEEIELAELIQEANISLFAALAEPDARAEEAGWVLGRVRKGIRDAIQTQTDRKFSDDYLVAKVEKLESAVRELTEDDEDDEAKFSVGELAIILDMDEEEIRSVLRLTGDDVESSGE